MTLKVKDIMEITGMSQELAEGLYSDLLRLPEVIREYVSENLSAINAYNADEIRVVRPYGSGIYAANIVVKRVKGFHAPLYHKYCFNALSRDISAEVY